MINRIQKPEARSQNFEFTSFTNNILLLAMKLLIISGFWFLVSGFCNPASALNADLSAHRVNIDSRFTGTDILLFGAREESGDIVVLIRGPAKDITVRQKERVAGVWMNTRSIKFDNIPQLYLIAANKDISSIADPQSLKTLGLGVDNLGFDLGILSEKNFNTGAENVRLINQENEGDISDFAQAFIEVKANDDLYKLNKGGINFMGENLFRSVFALPSKLPRGDYLAEIYLFKDGFPSGFQVIPLEVRKSGFDAMIYDLAHESPFFYGLIAIFVAISAGWGANAIFSRV